MFRVQKFLTFYRTALWRFLFTFCNKPRVHKAPLEHSTMCDSRTYLNCILECVHLQNGPCMLEPSTIYEFSFFPRTVAAWKEFELPSDTILAQIWQCSNRTLPLLIISCPGPTNHCLTPCFYLSLLLTVLSLSSPVLTNNLCFLSPLPYMPISILLDGKLCT